MILPFPRKERVEAYPSHPDSREADLLAMAVMLSYLEDEAVRLKLPRLAELVSDSLAELRRS